MTRLRKMATNCNFIIQNCQLKRLRRYALIESDTALAKLIAKGRAYELSEIQASGIEQSLAPRSLHDEDSQSALTVNTPRTQEHNRPYKPDPAMSKLWQAVVTRNKAVFCKG